MGFRFDRDFGDRQFRGIREFEDMGVFRGIRGVWQGSSGESPDFQDLGVPGFLGVQGYRGAHREGRPLWDTLVAQSTENILHL